MYNNPFFYKISSIKKQGTKKGNHTSIWTKNHNHSLLIYSFPTKKQVQIFSCKISQNHYIALTCTKCFYFFHNQHGKKTFSWWQKTPQSSQFNFSADVEQLIQLVTHSMYSTKEIFLRELVANANDAIQKSQNSLLMLVLCVIRGTIRTWENHQSPCTWDQWCDVDRPQWTRQTRVTICPRVTQSGRIFLIGYSHSCQNLLWNSEPKWRIAGLDWLIKELHREICLRQSSQTSPTNNIWPNKNEKTPTKKNFSILDNGSTWQKNFVMKQKKHNDWLHCNRI